jgi:hypothetical protein
MWPMYGTYIATLLGLAQINENHSLTQYLDEPEVLKQLP